MRRFIAFAAILAAVSQPRAAETDCRCFTPGSDEIAAFEERMAELPEPIYRYARHYAGRLLPPVIFRGQSIVLRRIEAQFVPLMPGEASAIHIAAGGVLPPLKGEGCIANIDTPPQNDAFLLHPRCSRPGGWTPSAAEIADMETRLALPKGAVPLARYARHYAGVTESDARLIQGVLLDAGASAPGVVIETEIELPLPTVDGCRAIDVLYNPETKQGSAHCNEIR